MEEINKEYQTSTKTMWFGLGLLITIVLVLFISVRQPSKCEAAYQEHGYLERTQFPLLDGVGSTFRKPVLSQHIIDSLDNYWHNKIGDTNILKLR